MSTIIPGMLSTLYQTNTGSRDRQPASTITTSGEVMEQKLKKPYIKVMMSFFILSCILQGYMPYTSYYSFLHSIIYFIPNLLNFIYIYLIFAYGLLGIYSVKRLAGIFLIIQPFVFITEFISNLAISKTNMDIVHPIFKLLLILCLIRLADMFLYHHRESILNFRKNIRPLLKALLVTLSTGIAVITVNLAIDYLSVTTFNFTNNYYVIPCFEMLNYVIHLVLFFSAIFVMWKILNSVSINSTSMLNGETVRTVCQEKRQNKKADIFICCVVILLIVSSTIYYLVSYGNKFIMYFQLISKIIETN